MKETFIALIVELDAEELRGMPIGGVAESFAEGDVTTPFGEALSCEMLACADTKERLLDFLYDPDFGTGDGEDEESEDRN